jgi:hypothetical protein
LLRPDSSERLAFRRFVQPGMNTCLDAKAFVRGQLRTVGKAMPHETMRILNSLFHFLVQSNM